jgi:predicted phosphodiesterase
MDVSIQARLSEALASAPVIPFSDSSRLILFSDCHRGDDSWADDFANNQSLFFHALGHYYQAGFTYLELGDGDELMENSQFAVIRRTYSHIFWLMRQFHLDGRFYMLWGNHDLERSDPRIVQKTLYSYCDERTRSEEPLFEGLQVHEALLLRHAETGQSILLVHGHQGDYVNDRLWQLDRFIVRHLWRHLQLLGVRDPTSPAENPAKRNRLENEMIAWVRANNQPLIAGHTHRPRFPARGDPPYFNDGCCVHPRAITGIEIQDGEIALIKWWQTAREDGTLYIAREVLDGPKKLRLLLKDRRSPWMPAGAAPRPPR